MNNQQLQTSEKERIEKLTKSPMKRISIDGRKSLDKSRNTKMNLTMKLKEYLIYLKKVELIIQKKLFYQD
jgi:hypothetical protein